MDKEKIIQKMTERGFIMPIAADKKYLTFFDGLIFCDICTEDENESIDFSYIVPHTANMKLQIKWNHCVFDDKRFQDIYSNFREKAKILENAFK